MPSTKSVDGRHSQLRAHILQAYENINRLPCCWSAKHAGILATFLRSCSWPIEALTAAVDNRFQSEEINECADPAKWIGLLVNYARGPLDRYGKPIYRRVAENPLDGFESAADYFERLDRQKGLTQ